MTPRERFVRTLAFDLPADRLPMVEWAPWWGETLKRWRAEGFPQDLAWDASLEYFGLDKLICISAVGVGPHCPKRPASYGAGIVSSEADYEEIRPYLYSSEVVDGLLKTALELKARHDAGEVIIRLWLDGYFWFPRILLGIERHLYAFYEQAELMHRINDDLTRFNVRVVEALFPVLRPDLVGFAEDMSFNMGPMLSQTQFREFLTPYYQRVIPRIKEYGTPVLVDSDGDITLMIPWMQEAGIEGVYPLERQAGVDVVGIRSSYPRFLMMGGYDKMVMNQGEAAIRAEFDRLLPVMRSGGYVPSVDHQTPPSVSLDDYRIYIRLFREYCEKAVQ
jgi:hypothetical protein